MTATGLRPFWRYYGAKWRIAPHYPAPRHRTIIEPFAGAAGYSLRYPDRDVILVEKYHVIAEIWRWLIGATLGEVRAIPCVDAIADLPAWVPDGARWLVGFNLAAGAWAPRNTASPLIRRERAGSEHRPNSPNHASGWSPAMRERVAAQVSAIKHWRVIEGDYSAAPHAEATWLVDPPYQGRAGSHYVHGSKKIDYAALARWCRMRRGQAIVCEAAGADWLPFVPFGGTRGIAGAPSREAIWWQDSARSQGSLPLEAA